MDSPKKLPLKRQLTAILVSIGVFIGTFFATGPISRAERTFSEMLGGSALPVAVRFVIETNRFFQSYWIFLALIALVLIIFTIFSKGKLAAVLLYIYSALTCIIAVILFAGQFLCAPLMAQLIGELSS
ncbi:MAG: hypothetical protein HKN23_00410 [Verrucomicrobiales bacterium]|nr:hypothetical protein [Verrucomicrobiales bacterium]